MKFTRDDIKISFGKPVFYVNEEKKTVVCVLDYAMIMPHAVYEFGRNAYSSIGCYLPMGGSVRAKAKCHKDDKFDVQVGENIAFARAENMAYTEVFSKLRDYAKGLEFLYNRISDFEIKYRNHNLHNNEYIKELGEKTDK